jgi:hypothetical protein
MSVSETAAEAEIAIRDGKDVGATLASLSEDLAQAVKAIQAALPEEAATKHGMARFDPTTALEPLAKLRRLLENDDGEAADFIVEVRPSLSAVITDLEMENLSELVGDFDFEAALACLSNITSRLERNLKADHRGS